MEQEMIQKERPSLAGGRKPSRLRPPQISAPTKNKFGFLKEMAVTEKAEFEQLEKPESCKGIPCKTEQDLWQNMLGEPVCVGGVKKGILRYFGPTKFADGLWCGVELHDPIGKNDGAIDGVTYFHCKKQHGIFAPLSKVQPMSTSISIPATTQSSSVQQSSDHVSLQKDTTQNLHKQSYIGVSGYKLRTSSLKESSSNATISAGHHNSTFNKGLRKPKEIILSSTHNEDSPVGLKSDITCNVNRNSLTVVSSKECIDIHKNRLSYSENKAEGKTSCYTISRTDQYHSRSSQGCSVMNTTISLEKEDLNSTFTVEDDMPVEGASEKNVDDMNATYDLNSSPLGTTQILPKKCADQTFNATFTFDELSIACKAEKDVIEFENDNRSDETSRKPSIDELFNPDDMDDDQQSLDLDESLGILTPNQMKDFTVCIDQQSVIMLDGNISRIPKISSCDNIDDIPEDEVRDTFSQLSNEGNFYTRVLAEDNFEHLLNSSSFSQAQLTEGNTFVKLGHQFDKYQEFSLDNLQTSTPLSNRGETHTEFLPLPFNKTFDATSNVDKSAKNVFVENSQSENLEVLEKNACEAIEHIPEKTEKCYDENIDNCYPCIEQEELPDCSQLVNDSTRIHIESDNLQKSEQFYMGKINNVTTTESDERSGNIFPNVLEEVSKDSLQNISGTTKIVTKDIIGSPFSNPYKSADITKVIATDIVSSSFNNTYNMADNTKIIATEIVGVSSEKQICFENNDYFEADVECLKTERPASTYTVGSTDTGYQEDGDFDVRSELSVATQSPCSELPSHSMYNSNRNMGIEDTERHPIIEIMSDSDFFTDSGGIGFTESEMETDGEGKPSFDSQQECDRMQTVIEQRLSETEETVTQMVLSDQDNSLEDQSVELKPKEANETVIVDPSTTFSSSATEISIEEVTSKLSIESRSDEIDKISKVEKINSFIMADKEQENNSSLVKNSNNDRKGSLSNKTIIKTQPEMPRNKRDNVLKPKVQNDNIIAEKRAKKNVVSKIKLMIESSPSNLANKNDENNPKSSRLPKKSRWEDVTSKIAASMAVEKTKSKEKKEVKSRIDTNLLGAKPVPSRRGSRFESTRNTISMKSESTINVDVKNSRNASQRTKVQSPHHITDPEKSGCQEVSNQIKKSQIKPSKSVSSTLSNASYSSSTSKQSSETPHNASRSAAGVKSNISKPDLASSARKTCLRLPAAQTGGKMIKRDATWKPPQCVTNASQTNVAKSSTSPVSKRSPISKTAPISQYAARDGNPGRKNPPVSQKRPTFPNLDQKRPPLWASKTELSKEVQRLGALCEARTKELNLLKMQLRHATAGFEAFSVLVRYMSEDLDAFSHPTVAVQLKKTKESLNRTLLQIKEYQDQIEDLKNHHAQEISNISEKLSKMHDEELFDLKMQHNSELAEAKIQHEKKIVEIHETYEKTSISNEQQYLKIVEELKKEYLQQKKELEQSHAEQLSSTIQRHEDTKQQLLVQIKSLQDQYEELLEQTREMEDALHKSTDSKLQWISLKKAELEKEVDSLKAVLEMKQSEIRNLRRENLEMKKELEELPLAKDRIQKLEARKEELEAIMEEKSRAQSVLSTEHEQLKEYFEKESKFNKQLSMEKEELQWRLQQSLETASLLSSLTESSRFENEPPAFPTRLSASYHAHTSKTSEKGSPLQSATSSPYRPYRRSASLSDASISNSKKFRSVWDSSPLAENAKRPNLRSHSLFKGHSPHTSKYPKHRSFTLHSGKSFADHVKTAEYYQESSSQQQCVEAVGNRTVERDNETLPSKVQTSNSSSPSGPPCTYSSTPLVGKSEPLRVHHFELNQAEDTSPIVKLFQNAEHREGERATSSDHSFSADNLKLIQMEYEKNIPIQRQADECSTKESQPEFVVVLETNSSVAAFKANTDQTEDGGLDEASKLSDSIEGSFTSPPDVLDNSNNVSCSLQSSIISDDSAWSSTSFPPQPHYDVRSHDFVSPSSEDDSFSNSSGESHGNRATAGLHVVTCGEHDGSANCIEHSRCVEGSCQYRSFSPKNLAGEAMVQDDSSLSGAQTSEELSVSVSRKKHKQRQKSDIGEEEASKETWEISYFGLKERIVQSNNIDSPSVETTSQGHLMTNSNIDDISWDSEDMPSEPEE